MTARAAALLGAALVAAPAAGQQLLHHGADVSGRMSQVVDLVDAWADGRDFHAAQPRDLQVRVRRITSGGEAADVHLLLFGPWGAHHFAFVEEITTASAGRASRTSWRPMDVDGDSRNEIVLLERSVETHVPLDEYGEPLRGVGPQFQDFAVRVRYLDRSEDALLEHDVLADPDDPVFARVLAQEWGGAANAALQQAAGDGLFARQAFEQARYRYRVVREWAESTMTGRRIKELAPGMALAEADVDEPAFAWLAATRRLEALPPFFRRP